MAKRNRKTKKFADMSEEEVMNLAGIQPNEAVPVEAASEDSAIIAHEDRLDRKDNNNRDEITERIDPEIPERIDPEELPEPEAVVDEEKRNTSVVAGKYKSRYIENAKANGVPGKAPKRSNWDWLARELATYCITDSKEKLDTGKFVNVLVANNVDHSKWKKEGRGWEGRLRMTGRVVLQKIVADQGFLRLPDGEDVPPSSYIDKKAPADFIERYKSKK